MAKATETKQDVITGTGRRKTAVASVFMYQRKGEIVVNGKSINEYYPSEKEKVKWMKPFFLVGVSNPGSLFDISVKVKGSGISSQLEAIALGMSRALAEINPEYSNILRKHGYLTRDSRMVERKKYYLRKARKRPQYSKR